MTKNPPRVDVAAEPESQPKHLSVPAPAPAPAPAQSYRSLLGEQQWHKLHPAIQRRFSDQHYKNAVTYVGSMHEVYLSTAGKLLAHACRLIGTPLALYGGRDIPVTVHVYCDAKRNGMIWDRHYYYPNKAVNRVTSTKCIASGFSSDCANGCTNDIGLTECVGCGFGMRLKIYQKDTALYFESTEFFWQLGKLRIHIPDWLSPGKTTVAQRAINNTEFQFTLHVQHALLGNVFRQTGTFEARPSAA